MNFHQFILAEALTDLAADRDLIDRAMSGLEALSKLYGPSGPLNRNPQPALPPPKGLAIARPPIAALVKRKYSKRAAASGAPVISKPLRVSKAKIELSPGESGRVCAQHPGALFTPKGKCRRCAAEYQAKWQAKKNAETAAPRPVTIPEQDRGNESMFRKLSAAVKPDLDAPKSSPQSEFGDELEFSKPITCPKCKAPAVRLTRQEDADTATGFWTCPKNACQIRIAHIVLSVDRKYDPYVEASA